MRLTYTSGPLSFAIALEDPDAASTYTAYFAGTGEEDTVDRSDLPNLQAYLMYSSDAFTAQIVGLVQDDNTDDFDEGERVNHGGDLDWAIGGGGTISISDGFQVTAGAVVGDGTRAYANNVSPVENDESFWAGSIGVLAHLSEDTRLELGVGYEDYDEAGTALGFGGGVYWDPVSQVTLGAGATYVERDRDDAEIFFDDDGDIDDDTLEVFFGTWLRFP
jgi:hypothetical protein